MTQYDPKTEFIQSRCGSGKTHQLIKTLQHHREVLRLKEMIATRPSRKPSTQAEQRRAVVNGLKASYKKQFEDTVKSYELQLKNKGNRFDYNGKMNKLVKDFQAKLDKLKTKEGKYYTDELKEDTQEI